MSEDRTGYAQAPLGESEAFLNFQQALSRAATVNRSVLVVGERGSGKEIAATRLHFLSPRWQHNLVTVNCAALPPSLIETELFGYEAGAFTGATKTRKGRFEEAEGGTLFLDEIGLIPLEVQEKILRVVEYGTFERVGSSKTHESDVRIIGATNADLPTLCAEGKFKEDLLDRLSFEVLFLPPLRERGEDILLLAEYFAAKMAMECGRTDIPVLSERVREQLCVYPWPGNVRELKNVVERAVYRAAGKQIDSIQFNPFENPFKPIDESPQQPSKADFSHEFPLESYDEAKRELDIRFLRRSLEVAQGNQKEAAKAMGLTYDQFRGLYRKYKDVLEG
ncbi:MAG: sigma 54-interacting transcriptional regulator [Sphaerochaetaceae bacterium]|jgi:psp operon transcriptional activator|nr:sigma 54-interacting transcriptional regulator [Sphaerochaetaceae bacterium]